MSKSNPLIPFASESHLVWSRLAGKIHAAVWDRVGLAKVQDFVRQWADEYKRLCDTQRQDDDYQRRHEAWRRWEAEAEAAETGRPKSEPPRPKSMPPDVEKPLDPPLPLPIEDGKSYSPSEKWAVLAAFHDVFWPGEKISPWPIPSDIKMSPENRLSRLVDNQVELDPALVKCLEAHTNWLKLPYDGLMRAALRLHKGRLPVLKRWLKKAVAESTPCGIDLVTLLQAASIVSRSKKTLENRKSQDKNFPLPEVKGGDGKPTLWKWSVIRPYLESEFDMTLPDTFPASRFRGN